MRQYFIISLVFFTAFVNIISAQSLLDELDQIAPKEATDYAFATFKAPRIINAQSIETIAKHELNFIIQHRFGPVNSGAYNLFGLDNAQIRFGLEYGITDQLTVAIGRSTFQKTYDGYIKWKLLRQSSGEKNMPVSVAYFSSMVINGLRPLDPNRENLFVSRMAYTHQLLIARKFNSSFSAQIMPTIIHKNLVDSIADNNTIPAIGAGMRLKLSNRVAINAEYFAALDQRVRRDNYDSFSIGFDIETGGHVFQFHITNSVGMFDRNFITETQGNWGNGDILFGFNINRVFNLGKD